MNGINEFLNFIRTTIFTKRLIPSKLSGIGQGPYNLRTFINCKPVTDFIKTGLVIRISIIRSIRLMLHLTLSDSKHDSDILKVRRMEPTHYRQMTLTRSPLYIHVCIRAHKHTHIKDGTIY